MKRMLLLLTLATATATAIARAEDWQNGDSLFDATKRNHAQINIKWVLVENVQAACNAETVCRGYEAFSHAIDACSFWKGNGCVVYSQKITTQHTLGHEVRHCFAGSFHPT